jgi:hypothetical protein
VTLEELNALELEFLFRLGFEMFVAREEYDWYAGHLLEQDTVRRSSAAADTEDVECETTCAAAAGPAPGPASPASTAGDGPEDAGAGGMDAEEGECRSMELGCKIPSYSNVADASAAFFPAAASPALRRVWGAAA